MNRSLEIHELAAALAKAQAKITTAAKDKANPFFKSKYADLASVWDACREPLTMNGLSVVQLPSFAGGVVTVETVLLHSSGQWLSTELSAPVKEETAQAVGSATTYLRRYSLASVAGVAPDDDDGNATSRPTNGNGNTQAAQIAATPGFDNHIATNKAAKGLENTASRGEGAVTEAKAFEATSHEINAATSAADCMTIDQRLPTIKVAEGQRKVLKAMLTRKLESFQ